MIKVVTWIYNSAHYYYYCPYFHFFLVNVWFEKKLCLSCQFFFCQASVITSLPLWLTSKKKKKKPYGRFIWLIKNCDCSTNTHESFASRSTRRHTFSPTVRLQRRRSACSSNTEAWDVIIHVHVPDRAQSGTNKRFYSWTRLLLPSELEPPVPPRPGAVELYSEHLLLVSTTGFKYKGPFLLVSGKFTAA